LLLLLLLQWLIAKGIPFRILVFAEPPAVPDNSICMQQTQPNPPAGHIIC
jgi:hypothetical protein